MAKHITVRLAWHNDGWNGCICKDPKRNTYCSGRYSYPGDIISKERDLVWETDQRIAGQHCSNIDKIPPCCYSINTFGDKPMQAKSEPPVWFRDDSKGILIDLPPSTACVWNYEGMYGDDAVREAGSEQKYDYEVRLSNAKEYFEQLTPNKTLLFYYANYSNPFSEEDSNKYVLVGMSRLKKIGKIHYYENVSEENKSKYANGFVWQMPLTSNYPDEGLRIPYHQYLNNPEILERIAIVPEDSRYFKYATRELSDDDALSLIEKLLEKVYVLKDIGDTSENWGIRAQWLLSIVAELWQSRGPYPGLPSVLDYIGCSEGIDYFRRQKSIEDQKNAYEQIVNYLNGNSKNLPGTKISAKRTADLSRNWKLRDADEQKLLLDVLPRFKLDKQQIANIISNDRNDNSVYSSLKQIAENPYLLSEQYQGDDYDDVISFYKIDHGVMPSPDMGIDNIFEKNSRERFRALCVDALRKYDVHSFISTPVLLNHIHNKIKHFPEWKSAQFNQKYFDVDAEFLSESVTIRDEQGIKYAYLKEVWEDEREIENTIKSLSQRPDITFKIPVTTAFFEGLLYNGNSPLATKSGEEYKKAIQQQAAICQQLFNKPICVLSGAAGTGKTTIIRALLKAVEKAHGQGTSYLLLAPTGKASQRIKEKTDRPASTIHSFLALKGWLNDNFTFKRMGGQTENSISTIIIDESSMIDLQLFATLFRAISWNNVQRLILVGDPNQLPPIGRGKVFSDIIGYLKEYFSGNLGKLEINVRQMENTATGKGNGILDLAEIFIQEKQDNEQYIKSKKEIMLKKVQEGGTVDKDLSVYYWKDSDQLEALLHDVIIEDFRLETKQPNNDDPHELWQEGCRKNNGYLSATYLQMLSPYRSDLYGVDYLNQYFQNLFNKDNASKRQLEGISLGDKVIQIRNRPKSNRISAYDIANKKAEKQEVYNGEIGFTFKLPLDKSRYKLECFTVRFDTRPNILYNYGFHKWDNGKIHFNEPVEENLELAYVISIHKAQGSEFDRVYLILPKRESRLLSMELLYTGITRASSHLTIFAQEDISVLANLSVIEKSNLRRINSSTFVFDPIPDEILSGTERWYKDSKKISTLSKYFVRSKSEMNIANILALKDIPFEYEIPLFADDGTMYLPDFTISWEGKKYYWEHLGMLDKAEYKAHWDIKEKWYEQYFPGSLLVTYESDDQTTQIQNILKDSLGVQ